MDEKRQSDHVIERRTATEGVVATSAAFVAARPYIDKAGAWAYDKHKKEPSKIIRVDDDKG